MPDQVGSKTAVGWFEGGLDDKAYGGLIGFLIAVILRLVSIIVKAFRSKDNNDDMELRNLKVAVTLLERRMDTFQDNMSRLERGLEQIRSNQNLLFLGKSKE